MSLLHRRQLAGGHAIYDRIICSFLSFRSIITISILLRVALILYSEWHDARSVVKYTDIDYRVFSDATHFILNPGPDNHATGPIGRYLRIGE